MWMDEELSIGESNMPRFLFRKDNANLKRKDSGPRSGMINSGRRVTKGPQEEDHWGTEGGRWGDKRGIPW